VHGAKQWYLAPPGLLHSDELKDNELFLEFNRSRLSPRRAFQRRAAATTAGAASGRLDVCVQYAGELLYIPEGWQHATVNVGEAVAVGGQLGVVDDDAMYDAARRTANRTAATTAAALRASGSPLDLFYLRHIAARSALRRAEREREHAPAAADRALAELRGLLAHHAAHWLLFEGRVLREGEDGGPGADDVRRALATIARDADAALRRAELPARVRAREADFASAALFDVEQPAEAHDVARACGFSARAHALAPSAERAVRLALCALEGAARNASALNEEERGAAYSKACGLLNDALAREPANGTARGLLYSVRELARGAPPAPNSNCRE